MLCVIVQLLIWILNRKYVLTKILTDAYTFKWIYVTSSKISEFACLIFVKENIYFICYSSLKSNDLRIFTFYCNNIPLENCDYFDSYNWNLVLSMSMSISWSMSMTMSWSLYGHRRATSQVLVMVMMEPKMVKKRAKSNQSWNLSLI